MEGSIFLLYVFTERWISDKVESTTLETKNKKHKTRTTFRKKIGDTPWRRRGDRKTIEET